MATPNYLLGFGERLARTISIKKGGGEPRYPWTFDEARTRLAPQWKRVSRSVAALPSLACPGEQSVFSITLHPSFLARSHYPTSLLRDLNLRAIGSRARTLTKEEGKAVPDGDSEHSPLFHAPEFFVAGRRASIESFADRVSRWHPATYQTEEDFRKIHDVAPLDLSRVKDIKGSEAEVPLEIVLHASENDDDDFIVEGFEQFVSELGLEVDLDERMYAGGLCFIPMRSPRELLAPLAQYSFVRVI